MSNQRQVHLTVVRRWPRRSPRATATSYPALITALVLCPDLANFISDNTQAWVVWLTLTQVSMAALCLLAISAPKTYDTKVSLCAAALWYTVQAVDEAIAGNLFSDGPMEYVVFLLYVAGITLHLRTHEREQGGS